MANGFDMPMFGYRHEIIDLHGVNCEDFLNQDSPDAWLLAILCDFGERLPREVAHIILTRLQRYFANNPARLRDYVEMLDVFADNRDLNLDIREELEMFYRMGVDKGREEGAHELALLIAGNMLALDLPSVQVAQTTGLPLAEVEHLAAMKPR